MSDISYVLLKDYMMKSDGEKETVRRFRVGSDTRHGELEDIKVEDGQYIRLKFDTGVKITYAWGKLVKYSNKFARGI